jgi:predicted ATP-grasp superfamily ATP-dependent carboligase
MTIDYSRPVLLLGGKENALSITRHLGKLGVPIRVSGPMNCWALHSRYCTEAFPIPKGKTQQEYWRSLLLGNDGRLNGHIIWALSDEAIEFINTHRGSLSARYTLDEADVELQSDFLDKTRTLELAAQAGVDAPKHWRLQQNQDLEALRHEISFPAMVRPIQSHKFTRVFGRKLFIVEESFEELADHIRKAWEHGIDVFVGEMIPGPDSLLSSYYTYRTKDGKRLFDFTKSIIRRWPVNRGNACYHKTGWLPETASAGARFFESAGLRGLGNIEFKRDLRDGKLKIIEVNARFTAAQELVRRAGVPIDLMIYCHLTKQPVPEPKHADRELRYWYPMRDFMSFIELRKRGELSLWGWFKSVTKPGMVFPLVSFSDPLPILGATVAIAARLVN